MDANLYIKLKTNQKKAKIEHVIRLSESIIYDGAREFRKKIPECAYCYYYGPIVAGQAMTEYSCGICGEKNMHANTATPSVCRKCVDQYSICYKCGASV